MFGYNDVRVALDDWRTYSSWKGVGLFNMGKEKKPWRVQSPVLEGDPPLHDELKAVMGRVVPPVAVKKLRDGFDRTADSLVEARLEAGDFDAVADLAVSSTLAVLPDAFGLRTQGREALQPYSALVFNSFDPTTCVVARIPDADLSRRPH